MDRQSIEYAPTSAEFDAGLFVGRYLQIVSIAGAGWSIFDCVANKRWDFNFGVILAFWAGSALKRRSRTAWKIVVWFCRLSLLFCIAFAVIIPFVGAMAMKFRVGSGVGPSAAMELLIVAAEATLIAVPLMVLRTPLAKRQFGVR